jgi:hypothetical protein
MFLFGGVSLVIIIEFLCLISNSATETRVGRYRCFLSNAYAIVKRKRVKMKKRLCSLILTLAFLLPVLSAVLPPVQHAAAFDATPDVHVIDVADSYILNLPSDNGSYLKDLQNAIDGPDAGSSAMSQMVLWTRHGVFGDKPAAMHFNSDRSACAHGDSTSACNGGALGAGHFGGRDDTLSAFNISYFCEPGKGLVDSGGGGDKNQNYQIDYTVTLNLGGSHSLFDSNGHLNKTVRLHWAGITHATHWPKNVDGQIRDEDDDPALADIPSECRPPIPGSSGVFSGHASDAETDDNIININIPVFPEASDAVKKSWGDLTAQQENGGDGSLSGGSTGPNLSCNVSAFNPLTWVICPAVEGMVSIVGDLDTAINSQLSVGSPGTTDDPNQIFCDTSTDTKDAVNCKAYHQAWSTFRDIALGLLAIISLVIIISEMAGFEFIDAYTIRKVLPRLIFAAIAITLSWQLMQFFVTLTNDLGYALRFLIYKPFAAAGLNNNGALAGGGIFAAGLIGVVAIAALGVFGLLSFAATAALAVAVAFLTLLVRQIIIIVLIILAPIAIIAYVLPNTQFAFRLWWDTFSKALLMFPLIAAMIAAGRVFAAVADNGSEIGQLMGFVAYFAPYFMIPLTFRFAGGLIGAAGGFFGNMSKNFGGERLQNYRRGQVDKNLKDIQNYSRVRGNNPVSRGLNTALGAAANPKSLLRGRRGVRANRAAHQATHGANFLKDNEIFHANAGDDAFLLAIANEDLAQRKISQSLAKSQDMSLSADQRSAAQQDVYSRQRALDTARQMGRGRMSQGVRSSALNELAKTGFQFSQGAEGHQELADTARSISGGDERAYTGLMDQAQYHLRSSGGRFDLAGINHGAVYDPKAGTDKASLYELANAKPDSIKAMTDQLDMNPAAVGDEHAVIFKELGAMLPNAKGASRDAIVEQMDALKGAGVETFINQAAAGGGTTSARVNYDPGNNPQHANWSPDEKARGWRMETRAVTNGDVAQQKARTYERPDPNVI